MAEHRLKTHPEHFQAVVSGNKRAEIRRDDRVFLVGDTLVLEEYRPGHGYTGAETVRVVTHVLRGFAGLSEGFVALSIREAR